MLSTGHSPAPCACCINVQPAEQPVTGTNHRCQLFDCNVRMSVVCRQTGGGIGEPGGRLYAPFNAFAAGQVPWVKLPHIHDRLVIGDRCAPTLISMPAGAHWTSGPTPTAGSTCIAPGLAGLHHNCNPVQLLSQSPACSAVTIKPGRCLFGLRAQGL